MSRKTEIEASAASMKNKIAEAMKLRMPALQEECDCIVREFVREWEEQPLSDDERALVIKIEGEQLSFNKIPA